MKKVFDLSVYFVADPACCGGRAIEDVVMAAVKGGVTLVQYRNKGGEMPQIAAEAAMLSEMLSGTPVPFLVNDYVDIALAVGADGVHLGQGDASPIDARAKLGENAIIGQTAFTQEHIEAVDPAIVDYIGTGPFYPTQTDKGKPVLGAEKFRTLAALSRVPVVGIGGITPDNAVQVLHAGANGVAMMRSISEAQDIEAAAREFRNVIARSETTKQSINCT